MICFFRACVNFFSLHFFGRTKSATAETYEMQARIDGSRTPATTHAEAALTHLEQAE
jgi:hypothetical protein